MPHTQDPLLERLLRWCGPTVDEVAKKKQRFQRLLRHAVAELCPQRVIKVAGTNGKGSFCRLLETALQGLGWRTLVFTSPHLHEVTERIRVNSTPILEDTLDRLFAQFAQQVQALPEFAAPNRPSFFETMLCLALQHFHDEGLDYLVLEAGIGGGHDVTSLIAAEQSVLTSVALDHREFLGSDETAILADKIQIAHPNSRLFLPESLADRLTPAMHQHLHNKQVAWIPSTNHSWKVDKKHLDGMQLKHDEANIRLSVGLTGEFVPSYIALLESLLIQGLNLPQVRLGAAWEALNHCKLEGRREFFAGPPACLLDMAHNAAALQALVRHVSEFYAAEQVLWLFGCSNNHNLRDNLKVMNISLQWCAVSGFYRALPVEMLLKNAGLPHNTPLYDFASVNEAMETLKRAWKGDLLVVCGSMFLVAECRQWLNNAQT